MEGQLRVGVFGFDEQARSGRGIRDSIGIQLAQESKGQLALPEAIHPILPVR